MDYNKLADEAEAILEGYHGLIDSKRDTVNKIIKVLRNLSYGASKEYSCGIYQNVFNKRWSCFICDYSSEVKPKRCVKDEFEASFAPPDHGGADAGVGNNALYTHARRVFLKAADNRCLALIAFHSACSGGNDKEKNRRADDLQSANALYETARNELLADIERADKGATPHQPAPVAANASAEAQDKVSGK